MTKKRQTECDTGNWPAPAALLASSLMVPEFIKNPDPQIYLSNNYAVLDYETDTVEKGSPHEPENQTILCSILNGPGHIRPGLTRHHGNALELGILIQRDVEAADFVVAHNAKFELGWMDRGGIDIGTVLPFCTALADFCRAGNRRFDLTLEATLGRYGLGGKDPVGRLIRLGVDTRWIPQTWLGEYCDIDVIRCEQLMLLQREMLIERGLLSVAFTRNILTPVLYHIEKQGLHLNPERANAVHSHFLNEKARLQAEWDQLTSGVNHASPKQLVNLLFGKPYGKDEEITEQRAKDGPGLGIKPPKDEQGRDMLTPGGDQSTDAAAMKALKLTNKKQRAVVGVLTQLTSVTQALSKTVTKLKACADEEGILYASFIQFSAGTHRLASQGRRRKVQLQNFPRDFRPVVCPRHEGWFMGDGDSAGIEFRTAVDLAKDDQGLEDIRNKVDVHANTARITQAARWNGVLGEKEGTNKAVRQEAKADSFKPLYGGTSGTQVQRDYFAWFRARYAGVSAMQSGWTESVLQDKNLRTASGLTFYWPGCKLTQDGRYIRYTTQIYDYPVQSFATAEMCPTATVYLWHLMRAARMESFLVNLVHDSAVGEIHPDEREQWSAYMMYCFNEKIVWYLKQVYDYEWVTPLESEVNMYPHWDDNDPAVWDAQWAE